MPVIPDSIEKTLSEQVRLLKEDSKAHPDHLRENALAINEIAKTFVKANSLC